MKRIAAVAISGFIAFGAHAAGKFPNHNLVTRFVGAETNETYFGAVNDGTVYKLGAGTVALKSPSLTADSEIKVAAGKVVLDYTASSTAPALPERIASRARIWLDSTVNVATSVSGGAALVDTWFDCREEAGVTADTATHPYAQSGIKRIAGDSDDNERRPKYVSSVEALGNRPCLDFGASRNASDVRWLRFQNAKTDADWVYAREAFVVFAKHPDNSNEGYTTIFGSHYANTKPATWTSNNGYLFFANENTRADKGQLRVDGSSVWGGAYPLTDQDWHVLSLRMPMRDEECEINQIGLDRDLPANSGGARIAEIILFETRLADSDRLIVEDYLRRKWLGTTGGDAGSFAIAPTGRVDVVNGDVDVAARLSGSGIVAVSNGTGCATFTDAGFTGAVALEAGTVRQDRIPFAMSAGQLLSSDSLGYVRAYDSAPGVAEKAGMAEMTVASVGSDVATLRVSEGKLRLAPPAGRADVPVVPATFPNADFEDFMAYCTSPSVYVQNFAGNGGQCATNSNWVFDRSAYQSGGALALVIFKTAWKSGNTWSMTPDDDLGLGYDGGAMGYLYQGRIVGFFRLPQAGRYRLSCRVACRADNWLLKPVRVLVDDVEVGQTSSFDAYAFKRWEISLPYLDAGDHEVAFADCGDTKILIFDDVKIVPETVGEEGTAVAVANPGFESPVSNINGSKDVHYRPSVLDLTGWTTVPVEPSAAFYSNAVARAWFHGVTNSTCIGRGLLTYPEEFPDGFVAGQLHGDGTFAQDVEFPSAGRYRLAFDLAKRCGLAPQVVEVRIGGTVVKSVAVRNDAFRRYEAVFDVDEAGVKSLSFAGTVKNAKEFLNGSAFLDNISIVRISTSIPENAVANGDFENDAIGWTLGGSASLASAHASWVNGVVEQGLQGTDAIILGKAASSAEQDVVLEAGRHVLSFRILTRLKYPERSGTTARFTVTIGDDTLYTAHLTPNGREQVLELPFTVASAGSKTLRFTTSSNTSAHMAAIIDDVSVVKSTAAATVAEDALGEDLAIDVALGGALVLDYDGIIRVKKVRLAGRSVSGAISAASHPEYVSGRGLLYVPPRGSCLTFR